MSARGRRNTLHPGGNRSTNSKVRFALNRIVVGVFRSDCGRLRALPGSGHARLSASARRSADSAPGLLAVIRPANLVRQARLSRFRPCEPLWSRLPYFPKTPLIAWTHVEAGLASVQSSSRLNLNS